VTVAVVGGRGVIGSAIAERLRAAGLEVVVVTHARRQAGVSGFRYGDLDHPETLPAAVAGADVVVQSANFSSYPIEKTRRERTFMTYDGIGTERLVHAAREARVRRYVFISGAGTDAASSKPYYRALARGERAVLECGLEAVCLRPTLVFGPRDRGLNRILAFARRTHVVPLVGSGAELHQPVYVADVAECVHRLVPRDAPTGVFSVGGPERFTTREMLRRLFAFVGLHALVTPVPEALARFGASVLARLPGQLLTPAAIDFILEDFVADTAPLRAAVDLRLTPFEEGLATYLPRAARAGESG
jgi:nucleoside-diphosphate-sugar epimerase